MRYSVAIQKILERETSRIEGKSFDASTRIIGEIGKIHRAVRALEDIALNRNPTETEAVHARRTHSAGTKLAKAIEATRSRRNEVLNGHSTKLHERLREASGIGPAEGLEQVQRFTEIRSVVRGMKPEERTGIVEDAMKARDTETLSALFKAAPWLTGLDAEFVTKMCDSYQRQVAPKVMGELDAMIETDSALSAVIRTAEMVARDAQDPSFMAKIEEAERTALQAAADFDAATS